MTRPPGGRGGKSDAERAHYLEHGAEAWIAVLRQGFVESFAGQSRFFRELHHAASACDFTVGIGGLTVFNSEEPIEYFTFGYAKKGYPQLSPGTRYFMNMFNSTGCQPGPDCDVRITFSKPPGT